jgi:hypothetical protein
VGFGSHWAQMGFGLRADANHREHRQIGYIGLQPKSKTEIPDRIQVRSVTDGNDLRGQSKCGHSWPE